MDIECVVLGTRGVRPNPPNLPGSTPAKAITEYMQLIKPGCIGNIIEQH